MTPKLKICGMNHNVVEVAELQPNYLGFIFYEKSPRYYTKGKIPVPDRLESDSSEIKKVGVFVNEKIEVIVQKIKQYKLDVVQLHGNESVAYCKNLLKKCQVESSRVLELWKVFSIKDGFDFSVLKDFEPYIDAFLFDTKGKNPGGNGYTFNWEILKKYPSTKPFILSGGIGLEEIESLKEIFKTHLPILAIDINSKFEIKPGLKDVEKIKTFKQELTL